MMANDIETANRFGAPWIAVIEMNSTLNAVAMVKLGSTNKNAVM